MKKLSIVLLAVVVVLGGSSAGAAGPAPIGLGTAADFAVLAASSVTNTGPTVVNGDLGVSPGTAVSGFPPGTVNGATHVADAVAEQAQNDLTTAYNDAAGRTGGTTVAGDLGGQTLTAGVYTSESSLGLTGTLTLDGQGDASSVFIVQIGSTLTTASASQVSLVGGAEPCNVFWQVGSSATLGTDSAFTGTVLALISVTVNTGATIDGRALARNGAVTLDSNRITRATCPVASTTTSTAAGEGATTTSTAAGEGVTTTTGPGGEATTTTGPGGGSTATTGPRGGNTATTTTGPGGGITTTATGPGDGSTTTTDRGGRVPLARTGAGLSAALALLGVAMTTAGGLFMLVGRRGRY